MKEELINIINKTNDTLNRLITIVKKQGDRIEQLERKIKSKDKPLR